MTTVQGLWVGKLTDMEKLCMRSFLHHGFKYDLYTYAPIWDVPAGVNVLDANAIIPREQAFLTARVLGGKTWAGFSDIFRYKMLMMKGGWWIDSDFVCLKPFDFDSDYIFTGTGTSISPGFVKVPQNDPMIKWVYEQAAPIYGPDMQWGSISGLIEVGVRKFDLYNYKINPDWFFPVGMAELTAKGFKSNKVDEAYAVHMWNEIWRDSSMDKDAKYDPTCLYEKWMKRYGVR